MLKKDNQINLQYSFSESSMVIDDNYISLPLSK